MIEADGPIPDLLAKRISELTSPASVELLPSDVAFSQLIATGAEQSVDFLRKQLRDLIHADCCDAPNCTKIDCGDLGLFMKHLHECAQENCKSSQCNKLRPLWRHFRMVCRSASCRLCSPVIVTHGRQWYFAWRSESTKGTRTEDVSAATAAETSAVNQGNIVPAESSAHMSASDIDDKKRKLKEMSQSAANKQSVESRAKKQRKSNQPEPPGNEDDIADEVAGHSNVLEGPNVPLCIEDDIDFTRGDGEPLNTFQLELQSICEKSNRKRDELKEAELKTSIEETSKFMEELLLARYRPDLTMETLFAESNSQELVQASALIQLPTRSIISKDLLRFLMSKVSVSWLTENRIQYYYINRLKAATRLGAAKAFLVWLLFCGTTGTSFDAVNGPTLEAFEKWLSLRKHVKGTASKAQAYSPASIQSRLLSVFIMARILGFVDAGRSLSSMLSKDSRIFQKYLIRTKGNALMKSRTVMPFECDTWCEHLPKTSPAQVQTITILQLLAISGLRPSSIIPQYGSKGGIQLLHLHYSRVLGRLRLTITITHNKEYLDAGMTRNPIFHERNSPYCFVKLSQHLINLMGGFSDPNWATTGNYDIKPHMLEFYLFSSIDSLGNLKVGIPLPSFVKMFAEVCYRLKLPELGFSARSFRRGFINAVALYLLKKEGDGAVSLDKVLQIARSYGAWSSRACFRYLDKDLFYIESVSKLLMQTDEASDISKIPIEAVWPYAFHSRLCDGDYVDSWNPMVKQEIRLHSKSYQIALAENTADDAKTKNKLSSVFANLCHNLAEAFNRKRYEQKRLRGFSCALPKVVSPILDLTMSNKLALRGDYFAENSWIHPPFFTATSKRKYECPVIDCADEFDGIGPLVHHCNTIHKGAKSEDLICRHPQCAGRKMANFRDHMNSMRIVRCEKCGIVSKRQPMNVHVKQCNPLKEGEIQRHGHNNDRVTSAWYTAARVFPHQGQALPAIPNDKPTLSSYFGGTAKVTAKPVSAIRRTTRRSTAAPVVIEASTSAASDAEGSVTAGSGHDSDGESIMASIDAAWIDVHVGPVMPSKPKMLVDYEDSDEEDADSENEDDIEAAEEEINENVLENFKNLQEQGF